ncbi:MAG: asparagine synthase-related protein [Egibacteraceae bacterium]
MDDGAPYWVAACDPGRPDAALELEHLSGAAPELEVQDRLQVLLDGRLYDREELGGGGSGASDARLILEAYRRHGEAVVERVKGRFALVIWDGERGELLCVRDQLGTYPLFWAMRGEELLVSTGIEELVGRPGVSDALNRAVLAEHLCCRWPSIEDTHYEAVRRVPPGHLLGFGAGRGRRQYRYWDPVPRAGSDGWIAEQDLARFDGLFDQAVARCLEPGPAGILLSGGLDSVSVAAVATDIAAARGTPAPWALSLGFPHPDANEEDVQRGVAAQLEMPQLLVGYDDAVAPHGRVGATVEGSAAMPVPLIALWVPAYWHLAAEARKRGCEVILTGSGGDEMLMVSPYIAADLMRRGDARRLWRMFRNSQRSFSWSTGLALKRTFWSWSARPLLIRAARRALAAGAPALLRARWQRQLAAGTPAWVRPDADLAARLLARAEAKIASWPPTTSDFYYHECRAALDGVTASMELERRFEDGRRFGIPFMEPFWDVDLQDYLYRVPPDMLDRDGRSKGLVRSMLARRFPELGFERQKKVVAVEFANDTFAAEVPGALRAIGGATALAELGIVDGHRVEEAVAGLASSADARKNGYLLWHLLSLEAWVRPRL